MSKLLVKIDYRVAMTALMGIKQDAKIGNTKRLVLWADKMIEILDRAVIEKGDINGTDYRLD